MEGLPSLTAALGHNGDWDYLVEDMAAPALPPPSWQRSIVVSWCNPQQKESKKKRIGGDLQHAGQDQSKADN